MLSRSGLTLSSTCSHLEVEVERRRHCCVNPALTGTERRDIISKYSDGKTPSQKASAMADRTKKVLIL